MADPLLIVFVTALVIGALTMAGVLVWLVRSHLALKRAYQALSDRLGSSHNDLAGLCSAALVVDRRLDMADDQMKRLWAKLSELPEYGLDEQPDHAYRSVIQKVRGGASVNELMQSSGLSHDEAALLVRLHGSKSSSS
ncbi:MAG: DUF2802 domain-containing protein [Methylovulum sp.]|nr:DUF2802 domain-containing protein [Methylovulum sp.]